MKTVLFYRHRHDKPFRGHDLKVWDYFNHVLGAPGYRPLVHFAEDAVWDTSNPWSHCPEEHVLRGETSFEPDLLFLSGLDWYQLEPDRRERSPVPVMNLVQGVRNASPDDDTGRYAALAFKAIRICVSPEIEHAIRSTGRASGPVFTIPAALDLEAMPPSLPLEARSIDLVIVATKDPGLGRSLSKRLGRAGRVTHLLDEPLPRPDFLDLLRRSRAALFLPKRIEGPYLPALEGMALRTVVICPQGTGGFYCVPNVNCLRPEYREQALLEAAETALEGQQLDFQRMLDEAGRTAEQHDIRVERDRFLAILRRADELWRSP